MAYIINRSDGSVLGIVSDSTLNIDSSDIKLIGRNYKEYGEVVNENNVWMLEHFAGVHAPIHPMEGQCWWNSDVKDLTVYNGTSFVTLKGSLASLESPADPSLGDFWWDETSNQLRIYDGIQFSLVGNKSTLSDTSPLDPANGDMWYDSNDENNPSIYNNEWLSVRDGTIVIAQTAADTAQTAAETAQTAADTAQTTADTAQTAADTAQTAADTAQTTAETAQTAADTAQTTADNNTTTFYAASASPPASPEEGDQWYQTDTFGLYQYQNGWVLVSDITSYGTAAGIVNQGNLATQDTVDLSTEVTNNTADNIAPTATRFWAAEAGADVTGNNTALNIVGQGLFATAPALTSSNIGIYMADGTIGSSKLVANVATYVAGSTNPDGENIGSSERIVLSVAITHHGAPVWVSVTFDWDCDYLFWGRITSSDNHTLWPSTNIRYSGGPTSGVNTLTGYDPYPSDVSTTYYFLLKTTSSNALDVDIATFYGIATKR